MNALSMAQKGSEQCNGDNGMNSYRINGEYVEADEQTEETWQDLRDALNSLANAYGVGYDGLLSAVEPVVCDAISDSITNKEVWEAREAA